MNTVGCVFSIFFITLPQTLLQSHQNVTFNAQDLLLGNVRIITKFSCNPTNLLDYNFTFNSRVFLQTVFCTMVFIRMIP